jgi:hypothetical protein
VEGGRAGGAGRDPALREVALELFAGPLSALVPEELRRDLVSRYGVDPPAWSCLIGFLELFGGTLWLVDDFLVRIRGLVDAQADAVLAHVERSGLDSATALAVGWSGAYSWFLWLTRPLTLLAILLTVTGMVRLLAFAVTREAVAEPLVWLGWRAWRTFAVAPARAAVEAHRFGPPRPDRLLSQADGTLVVLCARRRSEWNELMAIEVEGRFYRLAGVEEHQEGGYRWHAHVLEELPDSAVLRGLVRYEPPSPP